MQTCLGLLIARYQSSLGMTDRELVSACGYQNVAKGLRRLDSLRLGNLTKADRLVRKLPMVLGASTDEFEEACSTDQQRFSEQAIQRAEANFKSHAIIICDRKVPEPLFVAAVIGIDRILKIDFAEGSTPISYVQQAVDGVKEKQRRWGSSALPAFGRPTAIAINYSLDRAIVFNLSGEAVETFNRPFHVGCTLSLGRNLATPDKVQFRFT
jgi:hypothetical protein